MKSSRPVNPDATAPPRSQFPAPIPGIIPFGTVTLFSGSSGAGKSTMIAEWCTRWRDGKSICGHPTNKPTQIYYFAADRAWEEDGAILFGKIGYPDIPHYTLADDLTIPNDLKSQANAHKLFLRGLDALNPVPGSHVILDPLTPLFIAGDPNSQRPVAWALLALGQVCRARQINILCTAHFSKQKADLNERYTSELERTSGSTAFQGWSHTGCWLMEPEPPGELAYRFGWRPRHSLPEQRKFARDEKTGLFVPYHAYEGMEDTSDTVETDRPSQLFLLIPDDDSGIDRADLVEVAVAALGVSQPTIYRDIQVLKDRRLIRVAGGCILRRKPS
jgi:hypothetical protein